MNFKTFLIIIILLLSIFLVGCGVGDKYTEFAKCLTKEQVVMYGSFWCPHCNNMKQKFGNAIQYLNYIECDERGTDGNPELCKQKDVKYLPTFEFKDGTKLNGEITFKILSDKTGCKLPQ